MIRIELDEPTLARTRIAISPLWEAVCSLFLLARNPDDAPWPYTAWARNARRVLAEVPETAPVRVYLEPEHRMPDFFMPIPPSPAPTLDEELAALRATPRGEVDEWYRRYYPAGIPAWRRPFSDDPPAAFGRLADGLAAYWRAAIAPYWPAMRSALDEEVLHRARALAADGPDALLGDLHERVRWARPILTLVKPLDQSFSAVNQRLLLIPLIFSRGALACSSDHPDVVAVSYQARGAVLLAEQPPVPTASDEDQLTILVGRGRAAVLRALTRPASTTSLAAALGLAPSTVSEHLAALAAAGVVSRRRSGRRVLYGLEPAGIALINLFGHDRAGIASA